MLHPSKQSYIFFHGRAFGQRILCLQTECNLYNSNNKLMGVAFAVLGQKDKWCVSGIMQINLWVGWSENYILFFFLKTLNKILGTQSESILVYWHDWRLIGFFSATPEYRWSINFGLSTTNYSFEDWYLSCFKIYITLLCSLTVDLIHYLGDLGVRIENNILLYNYH